MGRPSEAAKQGLGGQICIAAAFRVNCCAVVLKGSDFFRTTSLA
jgi:hypothetical protein